MNTAITLYPTTLSRRRFCQLLAVAPLAAPGAAQAQDEVDLPAATLFLAATSLLRHGRTFEKATAYLVRAGAKEPTRAEYALALGCAYVSRVASLAYADTAAQMLAQERAEYPTKLRAWQAERDAAQARDPKGFDAALYDNARPVEPPFRNFPTKDDGVVYHLTPAELETQLSALIGKAEAAWARGLVLATTPAQKAEAYYVRGWGRRVLERYLDTAPGATKNVPTKTQIRADFERAVTLAPDNPLYWQAKGDIMGEDTAAFAAYEKAADLSPRNPNLLYYLYAKVVSEGSEPDRWAKAQKYLQQAQTRDRSNAWPCYEEAGILFRYAPYSLTGSSGNPDATPAEKEVTRNTVRNAAARKQGRQAINLILRGNGLPRYNYPQYQESVPDLLAAAWHYGFVEDIALRAGGMFTGFARVRELARSATSYGVFVTEYENNAAEGVRACRATIGMGKRLVGDWSLEEDFRAGKTMIMVLVGAAIVAIGYKSLVRVCTLSGDRAALELAQAESDAFAVRTADYKKAVTEKATKMSHPTTADVY